MKHPLPDVFVVILNWNGWKDTIDCLKSLESVYTHTYKLHTIIVDNGSTNDSVPRIKKAINNRQNTLLIEHSENLGFAGGNNLGIRVALQKKADYIVVLNNDTVVHESLFEEFLKAAHDFPNAGAFAPKIYFAKGFEFHKKNYKNHQLGKVIWYAGGDIDWKNVYGTNHGVDKVDTGQFDEVGETGFTTGACTFFRSQALLECGLYDERYFAYMEDLELSVRMRVKGWFSVYVPKAVVWHKVSQSSGIGSQLNDYYITRNRMLFGMKYAPVRAKIALIRESIWLAQNGRTWQTTGAKDYYLKKFGKGSWK